ncbi:MAG: hypothetical protein IME99_06905, partial [Proteobacteria bacterium]|nr:hypothetical protein [Pseudomonadota bacterium]
MNKIYLPFFTIAISLALLTGCTGEKKGSVVEKATEAAESVAENVAKAAETVKEKAPE